MDINFTIAGLSLAFFAAWGAAAAILSWRWMVAWFAPFALIVIFFCTGELLEKPKGLSVLALLDSDIGHSLLAGYFGAIAVVVLLTIPLRRRRPEKQ